MNGLLFVVSLPAVFLAVVVITKAFKKEGLMIYACIAAVLANIVTAKQIDLFGLSITNGNILFASVFMTTDIISELYGREESKKTVFMTLLSVLFYMAVVFVVGYFKPNDFDYADESMHTLFSLSLRISGASVLMFFLSNMADVYLFDWIKKKVPNALWLRNNVATIICNCLENFAFIFLAFIGVYSAAECLQIAFMTSIVEMIIAVCDTPFVYLATRKRE